MAEGVDNNTETCLNFIRGRIERSLPEVNPFSSETGRVYLPLCLDVKEYFGLLRTSSEYTQTVNEKLANAKMKREELKERAGWIEGEDPTREEIITIYEKDESFKQLFWNFNEEVLHLGYDLNKYSAKFNSLFMKYRVLAKQSVSATIGGGKEEIISKDRDRSIGHDEAARQLVEDSVIESEYLARIVVRSFLIDIGEDSVKSARLSDRLRTLRTLESDEARIRYYATAEEAGRVPRFSTESRFEIQNDFLQAHPECLFVKKQDFLYDTQAGLRPQGDQENYPKK